MSILLFLHCKINILSIFLTYFLVLIVIMLYLCIVKLIYKRCLIKNYCLMTLKEFKSKSSQLMKVLNEYRVYDFKFTSQHRLEISNDKGIFTSVVLNEILNVFPINSDVDLSFFNGILVLERF